MKLRIARKMDQRPPHRYPNKRTDKRVWWTVYTVDQLARAERRLRTSDRAHCPWLVDPEDGRRYRNLTDDFFAANRVQSRRIRQSAIARSRASAAP